MFTVDMYEGATLHISLTGTAKDLVDIAGTNSHRGPAACFSFITSTIHIAANDNLCLHPGCRQTKQ